MSRLLPQFSKWYQKWKFRKCMTLIQFSRNQNVKETVVKNFSLHASEAVAEGHHHFVTWTLIHAIWKVSHPLTWEWIVFSFRFHQLQPVWKILFLIVCNNPRRSVFWRASLWTRNCAKHFDIFFLMRSAVEANLIHPFSSLSYYSLQFYINRRKDDVKFVERYMSVNKLSEW